MINRQLIKEEAKRIFKSDWGNFVIAALILIVATTMSNITDTKTMYIDGTPISMTSTTWFSALWNFLAMPAINVSSAFFFINVWKYKNADIADFAHGFRNYLPSFLGIFLMNLFIFLWALLFIIPGIIKAIAYSMTPYIIADNPELGKSTKALKISIELTRGHKGEIFTFGLSFFGWILFGIFTFGLGFLFVIPYMNTSMAGLYQTLKLKAINNGVFTPELFGEKNEYQQHENNEF